MAGGHSEQGTSEAGTSVYNIQNFSHFIYIHRCSLIDNFEGVFSVGMESETKNFMAVCVETVNKYPLNDFVSPVFIFERLCSIIYPVS